MRSVVKALALFAAIALPAAAYSGLLGPGDSLCFGHGGTSYRIAAAAPSPDFRIRIDRSSTRPDLRMQLVERPEIADFVLVDGSGDATECPAAAPARTVRHDADAPAPDVTVRLSADAGPADYRIFVQSRRFTPTDAAALLAAMWKSDQRRALAATDR